MTIDVRFCIKCSMACCTSISDSESSARKHRLNDFVINDWISDFFNNPPPIVEEKPEPKKAPAKKAPAKKAKKAPAKKAPAKKASAKKFK